MPAKRRQHGRHHRPLSCCWVNCPRWTTGAVRCSLMANLIHDNCERRGHFENEEFVKEFGDEGAAKGWCLYKVGCKGPETHHNCPIIQMESRHQLAHRRRASLHRVQREGVLGQNEPILRAKIISETAEREILQSISQVYQEGVKPWQESSLTPFRGLRGIYV